MSRSYDEPQELQALLFRTLPTEDRDKPAAMQAIAVAVGCTRATLYNWIADKKLMAHRASRLVEISKENHEKGLLDDPLSIDDFHKFVYAA